MKIITTDPVKTSSTTVATATEVKKQLNIESTFTDDDTYIATLIAAAVEIVEDDIIADIRDISNVLTYEFHPDESLQTHYRIPQTPLRTFTKLEAWDGSEYITIEASKYHITTNWQSFEIEIRETFTATKLRFTYSTGYTDAKRPAKLKQAVILKAADMYDTERSSYAQGVTPIFTYDALIHKHKRKYY